MLTLRCKFKSSDQEYCFQEVSFLQYKNFCKGLFYETDPISINHRLTEFIAICLHKSVEPVNVIDKILLLLEIRALNLGNDIRVTVKGNNITIPKDLVSHAFNKNYGKIEYKRDDLYVSFTLPKDFVTSKSLLTDVLLDSITEVGISNRIFNIKTLNKDQRNSIIESLPGLPIHSCLEELKPTLTEHEFKIGTEIRISPFDESILYFLKAILIEPYNEILDLEYILRRNLSLNTYDLERMPYPEAKIMLAKLDKENRDKEKSMSMSHSIGGHIEEGN